MARKDYFVVGVDFGTTFTGVGFAYSGNPNDVEIIEDGITSEKVPSQLAYELQSVPTEQELRRSNSLIDLIAPLDHYEIGLKDVRWGYQIKPGQYRLKCIKLFFLERDPKLPKFVDDTNIASYLKTHRRNVADAVADFLAKVNDHTRQKLCARYSEIFVNSTEIRYVLTVPAIWSDIAKDATNETAIRAGMRANQIAIISEPEAAAVYTLKAIQTNRLRLGDNIVVCDAGGGTVDLISYTIASLSPLAIEGIQVGTGDLCGSVFLNVRFQDHVRQRLGPAEFAQFRSTKAAAWDIALKYFEEYVKRNFNEEDIEDFNIPLPGAADNEGAVDDGPLCELKLCYGNCGTDLRYCSCYLQSFKDLVDPSTPTYLTSRVLAFRIGAALLQSFDVYHRQSFLDERVCGLLKVYIAVSERSAWM